MSQVLPLIVEGDRMTALFEGFSYEAVSVSGMAYVPELMVRLEADSAIAPYLSVQTRWAEAKDGVIEVFGHRTDGNPSFTLEGDASAGTERAVIEAAGPELNTWSGFCRPDYSADSRLGGPLDEYVFVDVWLVDRVGIAIHIGTYTGSFEMNWKEAGL